MKRKLFNNCFWKQKNIYIPNDQQLFNDENERIRKIKKRGITISTTNKPNERTKEGFSLILQYTTQLRMINVTKQYTDKLSNIGNTIIIMLFKIMNYEVDMYVYCTRHL